MERERVEADGIQGSYVSYCRLAWDKPFIMKWPNFFRRVKVAFKMIFNIEHFIMLTITKDVNDQMRESFDGRYTNLTVEIIEVK